MNIDVLVVGAGPAGIMAAARASELGKKVVLIEKNSFIGKKMMITGNGRCNITNICDTFEMIEKVSSNQKFLYSAFKAFSNYDMISLLSEYGVNIKIEEDGKVFPESDKSIDVINALNKYMNDMGVELRLNSEITKILKDEENNFLIKVKHKDKKQLIKAKSVIICTGGKSYPQTGSTGDGYRFAIDLGHSITSLKPALVPMELQGDFYKKLQGVSLENINLKLFVEDKEVYYGVGDMIFTHFGISGPVVMKASNYVKEDNKETHVLIDMMPDKTFEELEEDIIALAKENPKKKLKNILQSLLKNRLIESLSLEKNIDLNKTCANLSKVDRKNIVEYIKETKLRILKLRDIKDAYVTSGGINVKEVNPSTMESKKVKGLFFAGEVLDLDAETGGYNLQIAYSTGFLAGSNC